MGIEWDILRSKWNFNHQISDISDPVYHDISIKVGILDQIYCERMGYTETYPLVMTNIAMV